LIEHSDIIVECSGDPIHAADVTDLAFSASLPVVTMNTEFHVTCGSYFVSKGLLTEAEGDQPGCLAALAEEAVSMGFKPLVYGNVKGFYNNNPTLKDMQFWSKKQGISLAMVTSATDGTKLQAEQVLVANGLNATIAQQGLLGFQSDNLEEDGLRLADIAKNKGRAISDYLISANEETRVFIVAEHSEYQQASLEYLKLGKGPYYTLTKNRVLCHLEILKTVKRVISQKTPLLNNSGSPTISLCAIAKMDLPSGTHIAHAIGSFEIRGIAIKITDYPQHIPIGLLSDAVITKAVEKGEVICFNHIEIKPSLALKAWQESILIS
jgi:predicted homoserine dehydrogenase-like protein